MVSGSSVQAGPSLIMVILNLDKIQLYFITMICIGICEILVIKYVLRAYNDSSAIVLLIYFIYFFFPLSKVDSRSNGP